MLPWFEFDGRHNSNKYREHFVLLKYENEEKKNVVIILWVLKNDGFGWTIYTYQQRYNIVPAKTYASETFTKGERTYIFSLIELKYTFGMYSNQQQQQQKTKEGKRGKKSRVLLLYMLEFNFMSHETKRAKNRL